MILPRFKTQTTVNSFVIRQFVKNQNRIKNRIIKIEHNPGKKSTLFHLIPIDYYTLNLYNSRGNLKESFIIRGLMLQYKGEMNIQEENYHVVKIDNLNPGEENDPPIADIYFLDENDLAQFLTGIEKVSKIKEDSFEENEIAPGESPENEVQFLNTSLERTSSKDGGDKSNPDSRRSSKEDVPGNAKISSTGSLQEIEPVKRFESLKRSETEIDIRPPEEAKAALKHSLTFKRFGSEGKTDSEIQRAIREKHKLKLDQQEFSVKVHGTFGIKHKRILRLNEDFEFVLFKKEENETYNYMSHLPMYDVLKVKPRGHDNSKIEFVFKNDVNDRIIPLTNQDRKNTLNL